MSYLPRWKGVGRDPVKVRDQKRRHRAKYRFRDALIQSEIRDPKQGYQSCSASEDEITSAFTGFCAICGCSEGESSRRLAMDHCHESGRFRGWLCGTCNRGPGNFVDAPLLLRRAADYLEAK